MKLIIYFDAFGAVTQGHPHMWSMHGTSLDQVITIIYHLYTSNFSVVTDSYCLLSSRLGLMVIVFPKWMMKLENEVERNLLSKTCLWNL